MTNQKENLKNTGHAALAARAVFLDGIRGWASLVVLLSHIIASFLALSEPLFQFNKARITADLARYNYPDIVFGVLLRLFTNGQLAVLIFFVLSGYALSISHLNLARRNLPLAAAGRYFRLMIPIAVTSLLAYLLLDLGGFFNLEAATTPERSSGWLGTFYTFEPSLRAAVLFSLYDVFFNYNSLTTYNSSLWTMPIEIFGSIAIYAYLGIFRGDETIQWKVIAASLTALIMVQPFFACFMAGYLIAELDRRPTGLTRMLSTRCGGLIPVALFLLAALTSDYFLRGSERFGCLVATSMVFSVSISTPLRSFFSNRLSTFLGLISFPLYLIQIIVICSWSSYLFIHLPDFGISGLTAAAINILSTIMVCIVASILLLPVERFSIRYSKRIGGLLLVKTEAAGAAH